MHLLLQLLAGGGVLLDLLQAASEALYALLALSVQVQHMLPLPVHRPAGALQGGGKLLLGTGLEQVFHHPGFDGLLGILKGIVPGEDDGLQLRVQGHGPLHQFQAVHARHAHIRQEDVRHVVGHAVQGGQGIGAGGRERQPQALPVDHARQPFADDLLVVHQQQLIHGGSSLLIRPVGCRANE